MRNRRAIFSVLATSVVLALASLACEEDKPSEFDDQKLPDGGDVPDRVQGFGDVEAPDAGGGPVDCKPMLPSSFAPVWTPPAAQDVCTNAQITAYYDACLDTSKNRVLTSSECTTFVAAETNCARCIEQEKIGPVLAYMNRGYYLQNYPSCVALVQQSKGGTDTCGKAYFEYEECRRASCETCFSIKGSTFNDFLRCEDLADNSGRCKELADKFDLACRDQGYKDAAAGSQGAPECFGTGVDPAARRAFFEGLIKISCGSE